ncbi:MAG: cation transporter [Candidatus Micrarchaeota archaeon]
MEMTIHIEGMHCASCENLIRMAAEDIPGAKVLSISHKGGEAKVAVPDRATYEALLKAIRAEGYKVKE